MRAFRMALAVAFDATLMFVVTPLVMLVAFGRWLSTAVVKDCQAPCDGPAALFVLLGLVAAGTAATAYVLVALRLRCTLGMLIMQVRPKPKTS